MNNLGEGQAGHCRIKAADESSQRNRRRTHERSNQQHLQVINHNSSMALERISFVAKARVSEQWKRLKRYMGGGSLRTRSGHHGVSYDEEELQLQFNTFEMLSSIQEMNNLGEQQAGCCRIRAAADLSQMNKRRTNERLNQQNLPVTNYNSLMTRERVSFVT